VRIGASQHRLDHAYFNLVSPAYFQALRIPIVAGRTFTEQEARSLAPVALITRSAAARLWPGQSPLGQSIVLEAPLRTPGWQAAFREARVVGVTGDIIGHPLMGFARPAIHFPAPLRPDRYMAAIARGKAAPDDTRRSFETDMARAGLFQRGGRIIPLQEAVDWISYPHRAAQWLSTLLGSLALLLTITGMYGVMSYLVNQRTKEIGIRIAVGATRLQILKFVISYSAKLSLIGLGLGLVLALGVSQYFSSTLGTYMDVFDLPAYLLAPAIVALAALAAALLPARRAAKLDPLPSLRE
jgi:hypothetical protein